MATVQIGDAAATEKYSQVRDQLTRLLYYGGKDVPVQRAAQLLGLLAEFEEELVSHGPGLIKGDLANASISNEEISDAWKINWWRTQGLTAMKPTDVIPSGKYALEIYGPSLNVINAGAFLAYAKPSVIEKIYVALEPLTKELAKLPAGIAHGAGKVVGDIVKGAVGGAAEGIGTTGLVLGGLAVVALVLVMRK